MENSVKNTKKTPIADTSQQAFPFIYPFNRL